MSKRTSNLVGVAAFIGTVLLLGLHAVLEYRQPEIFRGTHGPIEVLTEEEFADRVVENIGMLRSVGREPERYDFTLPEGWEPPADWEPPPGWNPPHWWP